MLLYIHTKTPTADVYTLRSREIYWGFLAVLLGLPILWIVFISYPNIYAALTLLWFLLLLVFMVDILPIWWKRTVNGWRGKKITASGNAFRGDARMEIEK